MGTNGESSTNMSPISKLAALPEGTLGPRSLLIVTYALCGVANLASVGLLVSSDRHAVSRTPGRGGRVGDEKLDRGATLPAR